MTVIEALSSGLHSGKDIAAYCDCTERQVREKVVELRMQGYPVISGDFGYSLSDNYDEIKRCASRLRAHGLAEVAIADKMLHRARLLHDAEQLEVKL